MKTTELTLEQANGLLDIDRDNYRVLFFVKTVNEYGSGNIKVYKAATVQDLERDLNLDGNSVYGHFTGN